MTIKATPNHCERCQEPLNARTQVMLELDQDTGLYHDAEIGIPEGHTSQGGFYFGRACARAVLANGGNLVRIDAHSRYTDKLIARLAKKEVR